MTQKKTRKQEKPKSDQWLKKEGELVVDVFQNNKEIIVQAPLAGVESSHLEIILENDVLKIKGQRSKPTEVEKDNYLLQECYWGPFSRELVLPEEISKNKIEASIEEGILMIILPKKNPDKEAKIEVKK